MADCGARLATGGFRRIAVLEQLEPLLLREDVNASPCASHALTPIPFICWCASLPQRKLFAEAQVLLPHVLTWHAEVLRPPMGASGLDV